MNYVTDEGALLILVNRHNGKYNGSICNKANSHKCGAQEYFRKNYCSKEIPYCSDMRLFCEDETAHVFKVVREHEKRVFEETRELIKSGKKPIIFFYTPHIRGNIKNYYITGLYVVRDIKVFATEYDKFEYQIYPERFVRIPHDVLSNVVLWNDSLPDSNLYWIRQVYKSAVAPAIDEILRLLKRLDIGEYGRYINVAEELLRQLYGDVDIESVAPSREKAEYENISLVSSGNSITCESPSDVKDPNIPRDNAAIDIKQHFEKQVYAVRDMASEEGFYYSEKVVRAVCSSLMINPLLILSGISGGGKSSLVRFYAKAVGGDCIVVSVRPDWTNPSHLLGVYNPFTRDFVPTPLTEFIRNAGNEWRSAVNEGRDPRPFIVLLDEMNLARVEYYFSDFLSKMQMQEDKFRKLELYYEDEGNYPSEILIPENVKIIGTVNIDETTHLFSPKVLDRASYINLNEIDIEGMGGVLKNRIEGIRNLDIIKKHVLPELRDLNYKLAEYEQPFGYRTVWDIIRWIDYSLTVGNVDDVHEGIDIQIESKILIKLSDSRKAFLFNSLKTYFEDRNDRQLLNRNVYERCLQRLDTLINRAMRDEYAIGQQY